MAWKLLLGGLPRIFLAPFYQERVLPLPGCFFGLRECRIGRKGVGEEEKGAWIWLGKKVYRMQKRKF